MMSTLLILVTALSSVHLTTSSNHKFVDPFLFTGISPLLYDNVKITDHNISRQCRKNLNSIKYHLEIGSSWAYEFLDSSSRSSPGLMSGTVTILGDYDQCLDIFSEQVHPAFNGKHCMIEIAPPLYSNVSRLHPVLQYFNPNFAHCVPSTCTESDVTHLFSERINGWRITEVYCDTKESTSFIDKVKYLNTPQNVSLCVIVVILLLELLATATHFFGSQIHGKISALCLIHSTTSLLNPRYQTGRTLFVDGFKMFMIWVGIAAHTMLCLEKFVGVAMTRNLESFHAFFSSFLTQPINETGFDFFSVLSGFTIATTCYRPIQTHKFDFRRLIMSRYFRFVPPTLIIVALQLLWPLASNGPLYNRYGEVVVRDCSNNWWKHFFFVANHDPERACLTHTFYTSVDFQLFIFGLVILSLVAILPTLTFILCSIIFASCYVMLFQSVQGIGTPVLFGSHINLHNVKEYMGKVHIPTYTHIPGFLMGILAGLVIQYKGQLYEKTTRNSIIHFAILGPFIGCIFWSPALHSMLGLIPRPFYPHFIVINKLAFVLLAPNVMTFIAHIPYPVKKHVKTFSVEATDTNNNQVVQLSMAYRIFLILNELSFSMHLTNYLFVQYNFLSSRILFDTSIYAFFQRIIYSMHMITIISFFFHILFVAPVENVRRHYFRQKVKVA